MEITELVVIGAGGLGREIAAMINTFFNDKYWVRGFADDGKRDGTMVNGWPVLGGIDYLLDVKESTNVVLGIGNPAAKLSIIERLKAAKLHFPNLIHPYARLHDPENISIGIGNVITDNCLLTTNINMGDFNLLNLNTTIGHDAVIGNFCSIMPGVNISGGAKLADKVYIGTGAKLIKATSLGDECTVGAGAVINTDIPAGSVYAGVPAKEVKYDR